MSSLSDLNSVLDDLVSSLDYELAIQNTSGENSADQPVSSNETENDHTYTYEEPQPSTEYKEPNYEIETQNTVTEVFEVDTSQLDVLVDDLTQEIQNQENIATNENVNAVNNPEPKVVEQPPPLQDSLPYSKPLPTPQPKPLPIPQKKTTPQKSASSPSSTPPSANQMNVPQKTPVKTGTTPPQNANSPAKSPVQPVNSPRPANQIPQKTTPSKPVPVPKPTNSPQLTKQPSHEGSPAITKQPSAEAVTKVKCGRCDAKEAVFSCAECDNSFCDDCGAELHIGKWKNHKTGPVSRFVLIFIKLNSFRAPTKGKPPMMVPKTNSVSDLKNKIGGKISNFFVLLKISIPCRKPQFWKCSETKSGCSF